MPTEQEWRDLSTRLNTVTNKLAEKLAKADELVKNAGISADKEAEIHALLSEGIATAEALGADPADPVPDEPPTV